MKNNKPKISVIVVAYTRRRYLKEAVQSVLNQTIDRKYYEIIVVKAFKDKQLDSFLKRNKIKTKYLPPKLATIVGKTYVSGIKLAKGNILCFLEDDDLFLPNKLKAVLAAFKDEKVGYFHNDNYVLYKGRVIREKFFGSKNLSFNCSSIAIRKELIRSDILSRTMSPDTLFYYFALASGLKISSTSRVLTLYRISDENASNFAGLNFNTYAKKQARFFSNARKDFVLLERYYRNNEKLKQMLHASLMHVTLLYYTYSKQVNRLRYLRLALRLATDAKGKMRLVYLLMGLAYAAHPWLVQRAIYWYRERRIARLAANLNK